MNGWRRVRGWGLLGCSNLTSSRARGGVARDVTLAQALSSTIVGSLDGRGDSILLSL